MLRGKKPCTLLLTLVLALLIVPTASFANDYVYKEMIAPQYDEVKSFSDDLAAVKKNGKWGYIDETGKVVIDFQYPYANSFSEDKAVVAIDADPSSNVNLCWGFIDKNETFTYFVSEYWSGKICQDFTEDEFEETIREDYQYYTAQWEKSHQFYNGYVMFNIYDSPGRFMYDATGQEAFYNMHPIGPPTEGIVATYAYEPLYYDLEGNVLFEDKHFDDVYPFNQGTAPVGFYDNDGTFYLRFIDNKGEFLNDVKFYSYYIMGMDTEYKIFNDGGLASIKNAVGKWGAINKAGETVIPFEYEELRVFTEDVAVFKKDGKYGYIDTKGNIIFPAQFDRATLFNNGLAVVKKGAASYVIDKLGNQIQGSEKVDTTYYLGDENDPKKRMYGLSDIVVIKQNGTYGFATLEKSNDRYESYKTWAKPLQHSATTHSWKVTFSKPLKAQTVTNETVYIVDANMNKVDFIDVTVENTNNVGRITLHNNGQFNKNEQYWIIIEPTVTASNGKSIANGLKTAFTIR